MADDSRKRVRHNSAEAEDVCEVLQEEQGSFVSSERKIHLTVKISALPLAQ